MNEFIEFCNLKRPFQNHKDDYLKAISSVCEKAVYCGGEFVERFEIEFARFCGVDYASCVNSGTSAVFLSTLALGIGRGDEVIVPTNTFIATAWGPVYAGATPVFVDCDAETWQIDARQACAAITDKTKAIIGVHLYGLPFDADAVREAAAQKQLPVIEDCAQAHGALYKNRRTGGLCDIGAFSFYPTKNLGAFGQGGCVTSNNPEYIRQVNLLKTHAAGDEGDHIKTGFNMRMDGIQAAVLSVKLGLVEEMNRRRADIAARYRRGIENPYVGKQKIPENCVSVYHLFVVTVPDREQFIRHLRSKNIGCGVHYRKPCHLQKAFAHLGYKAGDLPNAEWLAGHCVSLPVYPELTDSEIDRVIDACNSYRP